MTVTEWRPLALALVVGLLLGAFYFGGLWWTVRRGVVAKHPALWFSGSMLLRTSVALIGFGIVGCGHWERLVACLIGFIMARVLLTWLIPSTPELRTRSVEETRHAP